MTDDPSVKLHSFHFMCQLIWHPVCSHFVEYHLLMDQVINSSNTYTFSVKVWSFRFSVTLTNQAFCFPHTVISDNKPGHRTSPSPVLSLDLCIHLKHLSSGKPHVNNLGLYSMKNIPLFVTFSCHVLSPVYDFILNCLQHVCLLTHVYTSCSACSWITKHSKREEPISRLKQVTAKQQFSFSL